MENFDFNIIKNEFDEILTATADHLDRSWPAKYGDAFTHGGQFTLKSMFGLATINYGASIALYLISEERRLNIYLAMPAVNRALLESFFSIVFLLDDFQENHKLFIRNSWREKAEQLAGYREFFSGIPKWDDYMAEEEVRVQKYAESVDRMVGLDSAHRQNPNNMQRLPRVSKIVGYLRSRRQDVWLYSYFERIHYVPLSHFVHSQPSGIIATGNIQKNGNKSNPKKFVTDQQWIAISLMLSIVSELELHFHFGLNAKLSYVWEVARHYSDYIEEPFSKWYQSRITQ